LEFAQHIISNALGTFTVARYKVAVIAYYPMPFQSVFFQAIEQREDLELQVYYLWGEGCETSIYNEEFDAEIAIDPELLDGYSYHVLPNWSRHQRFGHYFDFLNPALVPRLLSDRPDLILISGWNYLPHMAVALLSKLTDIPYILRTDTNGLLADPAPSRSPRTLYRNLLIDNASAILYSSTANRIFYEDRLGIPATRLFSSPLVVDNARFESQYQQYHPRRDDIREAIGITNDAPMVLYLGKISRLKRPRLLLEGARPLLEQRRINLVYVGEGSQRSELEEFVADEQLPQVFFEGFVPNEEVARYLSAADIFVLLSAADAFGLAINEAMVCHNALLLSQGCGAGHDLLYDGKNGFMIPGEDASEVTVALTEMLADPQTLEAMKSASASMIDQWGPAQAAAGVAHAARWIERLSSPGSVAR
jgi:glycosyltransferase involved in cell wall biosynthesis